MSDHPISPELIEQLVDLSRRAGDAIMAIYNNKDSYDIEHKSDESPLTAADLAIQYYAPKPKSNNSKPLASIN
jgi:3'(2'), 5'-bisphosphate nucleotidase